MTDWSYLAGILDGEGYIGIYRTAVNPHGALQVGIDNTDERLLAWIVDMFGGSINPLKKEKKRHRLRFKIRWCSRKAIPILRGVLPYLKTIKRERAMLALKFMENVPDQGRSSTDEQKAARLHIMDEFRELAG